MSWLLLVFAAWCGLYLVNALRPVRRNRVLFVFSFFSSWLTIEGSPVWMALEILVAAVLVALGALDRVAGWVGLVILALAWIGQAALLVQARGASAAAADGPRRLRARGPGRPVSRAPPTRWWSSATSSSARWPASACAWTSTGRPSAGERRPAVLQIHGGGWVIGDKREQGIPLLKYLARRGWVGFNANYRLSPGATYPDHLVDLKAALVWIREHADTYGIDPDFVVVTGGSAGGHLTALMALTANDPQYQPGFEDGDTSVQAAVPFYGVYDLTNRQGTAQPEMLDLDPPAAGHQGLHRGRAREVPRPPRRSTRSTPTHRPSSSCTATRTRWPRSRTPGCSPSDWRPPRRGKVVYLELKGAQHAFDVFGSPRTRRTVRAVEAFLFAVHDSYLHDRGSDLAPPTDGDAPAAAASGDRSGRPDAVRGPDDELVDEPATPAAVMPRATR